MGQRPCNRSKALRHLPCALVLSPVLCLLLFACAPVLKQEYLSKGIINVSFPAILQNPNAYKGNLYIFGGEIVGTSLTAGGALVEAFAVPVDSSGRLLTSKGRDGRFLALYPKSKGELDPAVYTRGREITIAGVFTGFQPGKIENKWDYIYPVFEVKDMHLWPGHAPWYVPFPAAGKYSGPSTMRDPFWQNRPRPAGR